MSSERLNIDSADFESVASVNEGVAEATECFDCESALGALEEFLHRELSADQATRISEHLEECADCDDERNVGMKLTDAVKRACGERAPEHLRARLLSSLGEVKNE